MLEVGQFDGVRETCLKGDRVVLLPLMNGDYGEITQSLVLPIVTATILQDWLAQAQTMGETSWAKAVRCWAREQLIVH